MLVAEDRADHIDLNFGCPVPKVTRKGGGAALPVEARPVPRDRRGRREGRGRRPADRQDAQGHRRRPPHLPRGRARRRGRGRRRDRPARAHRGRVLLRHRRLVGDREAQGGRHERSGARQRRHLVAPTTRCAWSRETGCDGVVVGRGCLGRPWLFGDLAAAFRGRDGQGASPTLGEVARRLPAARRAARRVLRRRGPGLPRHPQARRLVLQGLPGRRRAAGGARDVSSLAELDDLLGTLDRTSRTPAPTPRASAAARAPRRARRLPEGWLDSRELQETHRADAHRGRARHQRWLSVRSAASAATSDADAERWLPEEHSSRRSDFARDRARVLHSSALRRLAAKTQVLSPTAGPRLRPQPAHPLARGRPGRPRARDEPRPRSGRRRHRLPRPRPRPPAVRPQRRARAQRLGRRHRRLRGQRADAAPAHPARAQGVRRRRPQLRAQPHPREPRRELQVPVARARRASPTRAAAASSASTRDDIAAFEWLRAGAPERRLLHRGAGDGPLRRHRLLGARLRGRDRQRLPRRAPRSAPASTTTRSSTSMFAWIGGEIRPRRAHRRVRPARQPRRLARHAGTAAARDHGRLKNLTSQLIGRFAGAAADATREAYPHGDASSGSAPTSSSRARSQAEIAVLKGIVAAFVMSTNARQPIYAQQREHARRARRRAVGDRRRSTSTRASRPTGTPRPTTPRASASSSTRSRASPTSRRWPGTSDSCSGDRRAAAAATPRGAAVGPPGELE